jgi:hypothetical protein
VAGSIHRHAPWLSRTKHFMNVCMAVLPSAPASPQGLTIVAPERIFKGLLGCLA